MIFKLFRKPPEPRPRFEQDASTSDALQRRVNAIEFQPSRGFLKDQRQPKRSVRPLFGRAKELADKPNSNGP